MTTSPLYPMIAARPTRPLRVQTGKKTTQALFLRWKGIGSDEDDRRAAAAAAAAAGGPTADETFVVQFHVMSAVLLHDVRPQHDVDEFPPAYYHLMTNC